MSTVGQGAVCPNGAMLIKDGFPKLDSKICEFCGLCQTFCPFDAIMIRPRAMSEGNKQATAIRENLFKSIGIIKGKASTQNR